MELCPANICPKSLNRSEEPKARETPGRIHRAAARPIARPAHSTKKKSLQPVIRTSPEATSPRPGRFHPATLNRPCRPMKAAERARKRYPAPQERGAAPIQRARHIRWPTRRSNPLRPKRLPAGPPHPPPRSNPHRRHPKPRPALKEPRKDITAACVEPRTNLGNRGRSNRATASARTDEATVSSR